MRLNEKYALPFLDADSYAPLLARAGACRDTLISGGGPGSEFTGWLSLADGSDPAELERIESTAAKIRDTAELLVVVGIGGSFMGAKSAIEFLPAAPGAPEVLFAGNSLSPDALARVLDACADRDVCVNVISKSGTTTEPAAAFAVLERFMEEKYGPAAAQRIFATTDRTRGTLVQRAQEKGYETFVVPDDVGGRYSVLTPVGLLPIAAAGADIRSLLGGAADALREYLAAPPEENDACRYAALRHMLFESGRAVEILVSYEPALASLGLWWQQLMGESHGKEKTGLFPACLSFSQDLHSMGQFIQQGTPSLFETVLWVDSPQRDVSLPSDMGEQLRFLDGASLHSLNRRAFEATLLAHCDGGTPNIVVETDRRDERTLGRLYAFFETACAIGGYLLGVNPFDQPGVEDYKRNMYALLGRPGYEELAARLRARLRD